MVSAWKFYNNSDSGSSRKLFRFSLIHLPVLMILFLVNKKRWIFNEDRNAALVPAAITETASSSPLALDFNNLSAINAETEITTSSDSLLTIDPVELEKITELERKAVKALGDMLR